jgi:hypothetical protein
VLFLYCLGICARQISQFFLPIAGAGRFWCLVLFHPRNPRLSVRDGRRWLALPPNFPTLRLPQLHAASGRRAGVRIAKQLVLASLIYLLLMRRQRWGSGVRVWEPRKVMLWLMRSHTALCAAPTIPGDELARRANDGQAQDAGKRRWLWFVAGHLIVDMVVWCR